MSCVLFSVVDLTTSLTCRATMLFSSSQSRKRSQLSDANVGYGAAITSHEKEVATKLAVGVLITDVLTLTVVVGDATGVFAGGFAGSFAG